MHQCFRLAWSLGLLSLGLCAHFAYTPDLFPDSLREWQECGIDHPSLVCDPDALLNPTADGRRGIVALDALLKHIQTSTECICDRDRPQGGDDQNVRLQFGTGVWTEQCDKDPRRGFTVSVAVLRKMEVTDDQKRRYRASAHLPAIFANELRNRLQRGQCADDALVVLAVNDSSIRTSTGGWAATKVDPEFLLNVSKSAQRFFSVGDHTGGLLFMAEQIGLKLGAPPMAREEEQGQDGWFWSLFPEAWCQSELRWLWLLLFLLLVLLLVVLCVFLVLKCVSSRRSDGYSPGRARP